MWHEIGDAAGFHAVVVFAGLLPPEEALEHLRRVRDEALPLGDLFRDGPAVPGINPKAADLRYTPGIDAGVTDDKLLAFLEAASTSLRPLVKVPRVSVLQRWLFARYEAMWSTAPVRPSGLFAGGASAIQAGSWKVALGPLLGHAEPLELPITVIKDGRSLWRPNAPSDPGPMPLGPEDYSDLADYTQEEIEYFPHHALVLHVAAYDPHPKRTIEENIERMVSRLPQGPRAHRLVGMNPAHRPLDLENTFGLYRLYPEWCAMRTGLGRSSSVYAFVRFADWDKLPQDVTTELAECIAWARERRCTTLIERLKNAQELLNPRPAVPALQQYLMQP
jgi:hypothetical protein